MKEHQETILFCSIHLLGTLLPLLIGLLVYFADNPFSWVGWEIFYQDGQFYLYSASLLTSSGYIFYTFKVKNTDRNSVFTIITVCLIILVSVLYALKLSGGNKDIDFLKFTSFLIFSATLPFFYYSNYLNHIKTDVNENEKESVQNIMDQL